MRRFETAYPALTTRHPTGPVADRAPARCPHNGLGLAFHTGKEAQQSGFAAAIAANQTDAVAAVDKQIGIVQQRTFAVLMMNAFESDRVNSNIFSDSR